MGQIRANIALRLFEFLWLKATRKGKGRVETVLVLGERAVVQRGAVPVLVEDLKVPAVRILAGSKGILKDAPARLRTVFLLMIFQMIF